MKTKRPSPISRHTRPASPHWSRSWLKIIAAVFLAATGLSCRLLATASPKDTTSPPPSMPPTTALVNEATLAGIATPASEAGPAGTPALPPSFTPTLPPAETSTPAPTRTPAVPLPKANVKHGFVILELRPEDGELADLLREATLQAQDQGLKPYIEFDADWCPACQAIATALLNDEDLMVEAFQGVYLIRLDIDDWESSKEVYEELGFLFKYIPIFFRLDERGLPAGDFIDGSAWGENIPENMAPPLKEFFQRSL